MIPRANDENQDGKALSNNSHINKYNSKKVEFVEFESK